MQFSKFCTRTQQRHFPPLLNYLHQNQPDHLHVWQAWFVERVWGGQNNLLYHVRRGNEAFAVKFTQRDERCRASREFHTLGALREAGLELAPVPYMLVNEGYDGRMAVIQSWLDGTVCATPPQTTAEWLLLLDHILAVQSVRPKTTAVPLPSATLSVTHPREFLAGLQQKAAALPSAAHIKPINELLARLASKEFPNWAACQPALLHCDPNLLNFVRRPSAWLAVDWENSGWGDPALEFADLMAHAAYLEVPLETWHWLVQEVGERWQDETAVARIWAYYPFILTMWVILFTQGIYDVTHNIPNTRLAPRPADWAEMMHLKYNHYLSLSQAWCLGG